MQLQCAILCLGISFVFALRRIDMMDKNEDALDELKAKIIDTINMCEDLYTLRYLECFCRLYIEAQNKAE